MAFLDIILAESRLPEVPKLGRHGRWRVAGRVGDLLECPPRSVAHEPKDALDLPRQTDVVSRRDVIIAIEPQRSMGAFRWVAGELRATPPATMRAVMLNGRPAPTPLADAVRAFLALSRARAEQIAHVITLHSIGPMRSRASS